MPTLVVIGQTVYEIWHFFDFCKTLAATVLGFQNLDFLTVRRVKRIKVHYSAIFRQLVKPMLRYGDISIFLPRADSGAVSK